MKRLPSALKYKMPDYVFVALTLCLILVQIILPHYLTPEVRFEYTQLFWLSKLLFPQLLWVCVGALMVAPFLGEKSIPLPKVFLAVGLLGLLLYGIIAYMYCFTPYATPGSIVRFVSIRSLYNPEAYCVLGILLRVGLQPGKRETVSVDSEKGESPKG